LGEWATVAAVGVPQRSQVPLPLTLEDDRGRISQTDEKQVQDEPAGAAVAVQEGVDPLELRVDRRQCLRERPAIVALLSEAAGLADPPLNQVRHVGPRSGGHPAGERLDVVLAE